MRNEGLTKTLDAEGAIAGMKIVAHGAAAHGAKQAAAVTDAIMGVSTILASADGERVDVIMGGIAEVKYGGTITAGQPVTTDANGDAVAAAPAAGTNNRIIGFAMDSGVSGDIGSVHVLPGQIQG